MKEKQTLLKFLLSNSKMPFSLIVESKESKKWLGRLDSNQRSRDQNPLPCRLATPQLVESNFKLFKQIFKDIYL